MNFLHYALVVFALLLVHSAVLAHNSGAGMRDFSLRSLFGPPNSAQTHRVEVNRYAHNSRYGHRKRYGNRARAKPVYYGPKTFVFEPRYLRWSAYHKGKLVASGRASGGRGYCPDVGRSCRTPVGRFRVYSKRGADCISSKFPLGRGGAPMPHCTFFRGGYAIHGSYDIPNFNASHGCIRVHPRAARWLSQNFLSHGTRVVVKPY